MPEQWKKLRIKSLQSGVNCCISDKIELDEYFDISQIEQNRKAILATIKPAPATSVSTISYDELTPEDIFFKFNSNHYVLTYDGIFNIATPIVEMTAYNTFKTANLITHMAEDLAIYKGKIYIAHNTKGIAVITNLSNIANYTLDTTITAVNKLITTHGRLYAIYLNGTSTVIKHSTDGTNWTTILAPGLAYPTIPGSLIINPNNSDIILGKLAFDGTNWYEHNIDLEALHTLNQKRMPGYENPQKLLTKYDNDIYLFDGTNYNKLKALSAIHTEKYATEITQIQYYNGDMIISTKSGDLENYFTYYRYNIKYDNIYQIHKFYFTQPTPAIYDGYAKMIYTGTNYYILGADPAGTGKYYTINVKPEESYTNDEQHDIIANSNTAYSTQGYFITPNLTFGDSSKITILKGININTRPLPANTSIKIYLQKADLSYELIATHDTDSTTNSTTYFNPCKIIPITKFKIELNGDANNRPEIIDINMTYDKKGI